MLPVRSTSNSPEVLLDYMSAESPTITHVRGIMVVNAMSNLRGYGVYDEYARRMPASKMEELSGAIASSWIPVELLLEHYKLAATLDVPDDAITKMGEILAQRISDTFFGLSLRAAKSAGMNGTEFFLSKNDRIFQRMYRGGGCTVLKHGPKDLVLEDHGNPLVEFPLFRVGYQAYMNKLTKILSKAAFVKQVKPREPHPWRLATRFSWV